MTRYNNVGFDNILLTCYMNASSVVLTTRVYKVFLRIKGFVAY